MDGGGGRGSRHQVGDECDDDDEHAAADADAADADAADADAVSSALSWYRCCFSSQRMSLRWLGENGHDVLA